MSDFFFAIANDDGTYEPIKAEIVDLNITTDEVINSTPISNPILSWSEGIEISFEMDYKQTKDFVWNVMLNLKQSTRHLVSKNIWGR